MSESPQTTIAFNTFGDAELDTISGLLSVMKCFNLTPEQQVRVINYFNKRWSEQIELASTKQENAS